MYAYLWIFLFVFIGEGQPIRDCWTVAFGNSFRFLCSYVVFMYVYLSFMQMYMCMRSDEERCIAAGYDNGDVKLFDLRTQSMRYETNVSNGVTNIEFDRKDIEMNKMGLTTLESKFRVFDMRTQHATGENNILHTLQDMLYFCLCMNIHYFIIHTLSFTTAGFSCLSEKAHKATVWCIKHLPQNRDLFMTGSLNKYMHICI